MVLVRIHDKRYHKGYSIKFFHTEEITEEVIDFVKKTPRAYWVDGNKEFYHTREEFLAKYG